MKFAKTLVALAVFGAAFSAQAESDINSSAVAGSLNAVARLDFRINVPRVVYLSVGNAGAVPFADFATVDRVDATLTAADVAVPGTPRAFGAGIGAYGVAARVFGNGGNITVTAAGSGTGLVNTPIAPAVAGPVILWTQITPASVGTFAHPVINGAGTALAASASGLVSASSTWTFSYANAATVQAGQYDGRVIYTATMP